ncbi:MAG: hypothetical protein GKR90_25990 [Pseudomonadales bacterium]|nr:hypothetical protein [Pseudomonadales bacterium]
MAVFIESLASYVPANRLDNDTLSKLTDKSPAWFLERTGIGERSRAESNETTSSMAIDSVDRLMHAHPGALQDVDLIIGASYTPDDTLSNMAARVQRTFELETARVYFLSTACTSFISCLELAELMLEAGKAHRALIVVSEHNSRFTEDANPYSGHLWGDGAAAIVVSKSAEKAKFRIEYAESRGMACAGLGPEAITLDPTQGQQGLVMAHGRDVFNNACRQLVAEVNTGLGSCGLTAQNIDWFVPHQANMRIINQVAKNLKLSQDRCVITIGERCLFRCASINQPLGDASASLYCF